jgi:histidine triad (HIT) family protein
MNNHAPSGYACPICKFIQRGVESEHNKIDDIVYQGNGTSAFISPKWWPNNPGHVMVVPKIHYENIYEIPDDVLSEINCTAKIIALALKGAYHCDGISTRQHNEPAGNQDLWHFHMHVFPRWDKDDLYLNHDKSSYIAPSDRKPYADKLREYFAQQPHQAK